MADHESVQQAETAAAGKVSELTEGMIRLLLQQRAQDTNQTPGDPELFRTAYRAYLERRVDKHTAKEAAADIATGLGSRDSTAIAMAEEQVLINAQAQAKEYRAVTATARDRNTPIAERQEAHTRRKTIEQNLGISGKPPEVRAQTINGLDPDAKTKKELRTSYRETLEQNGTSPQTAASASKDLANQKGAADSLPIAQAHREIEQHTVLKNMSPGIYEKHGVSPEVASQAADQLARGNGANRSPEVRKAHNQALANIENPQRAVATQDTQNQEPVAKEGSAAYSNKTDSAPEKSAARVDAPGDTSSSQRIWNQYSAGEQGVFESMARGNPKMQQMSDQLIAKDALLAGEDPKAVRQAIAHHSPHAKTLSRPGEYARRTVNKAELSSEVQEKRAQQNRKGQDNNRQVRLSRKDAQQRANQNGKGTSKDKPRKKVKAREKGLSY